MQANILPDGRLHLHHGPIDLLIGAQGAGRLQAYAQARDRFEGLLQELVDELPELRTPLDQAPQVRGPIARRMLQAIRPYEGQFVTPMAAVAGAVSDTIMEAISKKNIDKCYINNGGDVTVFIGENKIYKASIPEANEGRIVLKSTDPWRGIASSGWQGRSHSFGIADCVTVIAKTAAQADVAATMIANAVDLPEHPAIQRQAAQALFADSDLGARLVTVGVPMLSVQEKRATLTAGQEYAQKLLVNGLIGGALMSLQGEMEIVGEGGFHPILTKEKQNVSV